MFICPVCKREFKNKWGLNGHRTKHGYDPKQAKKPISNLQYGTLKYFHTYLVTMEQARWLHQGTILSLLKRGYLTMAKGYIVPSKLGLDALELYHHAKPNFRKYDDSLSDQVQRLLRVVKFTELNRRIK